MKARQRKLLSELQSICRELGGMLDGTATNPVKYIDRQRALGKVAIVIYGAICDDPENDFREEDVKDAETALQHLKDLKLKEYGDRMGFVDTSNF